MPLMSGIRSGKNSWKSAQWNPLLDDGITRTNVCARHITVSDQIFLTCLHTRNIQNLISRIRQTHWMGLLHTWRDYFKSIGDWR